MRVLMFGWEFPPYISGGLGTACYGITKGLKTNGVDVLFVVPTRRKKGIADEFNVLGADEVQLSEKEIPLIGKYQSIFKLAEIIGVPLPSIISPYYTSGFGVKEKNLFKKSGKLSSFYEKLLSGGSLLEFTGNYDHNLMREVNEYGIVGGILGLRENFDVIHAHDWMTFMGAINAKKVSGKPLVVHVHATEFDRSGENMNNVVYNIEKFGLENADRIIAVSYYTKNIITRYYQINPDKIEVVHNAIDRRSEFERYREKKNFDEKIVLSLGRITMQKGPEYYIEAANLVLKKIKNVRFVMAGSGDMMSRMVTRMARLKIANKFHFTGFLRGDDVEKMYAMSDLYVMPSVSEPFGLTAFEALMYDVPVIISKQSGVAEVLRNAVTVDFWDVKKLASTIIALLRNDKLSKNIVDRCKDELKSVGWNSAGAKIKNIYRSLGG